MCVVENDQEYAHPPTPGLCVNAVDGPLSMEACFFHANRLHCSSLPCSSSRRSLWPTSSPGRGGRSFVQLATSASVHTNIHASVCMRV